MRLCQHNQSSIAAYWTWLWISSCRGWHGNHQLSSEDVKHNMSKQNMQSRLKRKKNRTCFWKRNQRTKCNGVKKKGRHGVKYWICLYNLDTCLVYLVTNICYMFSLKSCKITWHHLTYHFSLKVCILTFVTLIFAFNFHRLQFDTKHDTFNFYKLGHISS